MRWYQVRKGHKLKASSPLRLRTSWSDILNADCISLSQSEAPGRAQLLMRMAKSSPQGSRNVLLRSRERAGRSLLQTRHALASLYIAKPELPERGWGWSLFAIEWQPGKGESFDSPFIVASAGMWFGNYIRGEYLGKILCQLKHVENCNLNISIQLPPFLSYLLPIHHIYTNFRLYFLLCL